MQLTMTERRPISSTYAPLNVLGRLHVKQIPMEYFNTFLHITSENLHVNHASWINCSLYIT